MNRSVYRHLHPRLPQRPRAKCVHDRLRRATVTMVPQSKDKISKRLYIRMLWNALYAFWYGCVDPSKQSNYAMWLICNVCVFSTIPRISTMPDVVINPFAPNASFKSSVLLIHLLLLQHVLFVWWIILVLFTNPLHGRM